MTRFRKGRQRIAAGRNLPNRIDEELAKLSELSIAELRQEWNERLGSAAPSVRSRELLLRLLAWQLQARNSGVLDSATERRLRGIASALERDGTYEPKARRALSPGVVLTREWKGTVCKVTVTAGGFQHQGKLYKSLSDIARTITGTRWSGPRFFGLEQKKKATRSEATP